MELGGHRGEVVAVGIGRGYADGQQELVLAVFRQHDREVFQFVGQQRPGAVGVAAAGRQAGAGRQFADHHIDAVIVAEDGQRRMKVEADRLATIAGLDGRPSGLLVDRRIDDGCEQVHWICRSPPCPIVCALTEFFSTVPRLRAVVIENFIEIENSGRGLKNVQRAIVNSVFLSWGDAGRGDPGP